MRGVRATDEGPVVLPASPESPELRVPGAPVAAVLIVLVPVALVSPQIARRLASASQLALVTALVGAPTCSGSWPGPTA